LVICLEKSPRNMIINESIDSHQERAGFLSPSRRLAISVRATGGVKRLGLPPTDINPCSVPV